MFPLYVPWRLIVTLVNRHARVVPWAQLEPVELWSVAWKISTLRLRFEVLRVAAVVVMPVTVPGVLLVVLVVLVDTAT
jgi:hypothetical protein